MRSEKDVARRLFRRIVSKPNPKLDSYPRVIAKCFQNATLFGRIINEGYFLITATCLYFMIDYPEMSPRYAQGTYGFTSVQLKEITAVNANMEKCVNFRAFLLGSLFFGGAIASFVFKIVWLGILLLIPAAVLWIGAVTFLAIRRYKVTIGTAHGGITIMGSTAKNAASGIVWNQPMAVIYNARPLDTKLMEFVENLNWIVSSFQERGEYAFSEEEESDESK